MEINMLTVPGIPKARDEMKAAEFDAFMKTGYEHAKNGKSIPAEEAFDKLLKCV